MLNQISKKNHTDTPTWRKRRHPLPTLELMPQTWEFPFYQLFYRVQGPLHAKSVCSRTSLNLFIFACRLDNGKDYQLSTSLQCTVVIKARRQLGRASGNSKRYYLRAEVLSTDTTNFYSLKIKELKDAPAMPVKCYLPSVGDQIELFYTTGDPNLNFPGIVYNVISRYTSFPFYNPPTERYNFLSVARNFSRPDDQNTANTQKPINEPQLAFRVSTVDPIIGSGYPCQLTPCTYVSGQLIQSFESLSFYIRVQPTSYTESGDELQLIGRVVSLAKNLRLATFSNLCCTVSNVPLLVPNCQTTEFSDLFQQGHVQINYNRLSQQGFVRYLVSPHTPAIGLFPFFPQ